jgi:hypothetical protein
MNLPMPIKNLLRVAERESPAILTTLGVTGFITTIIFAVKATEKAIYLIENDPRRLHGEILTTRKKIEIGWKCYIPTALMGLGSIACFVGANRIHLRRNAALAGLYSLSEAALKEYQEKVVEIIGKNKEEKIHDSVIQDKLDKSPASSKEVVITGKGDALFFDPWSGRYFKSEMEKVRRAQNDLNAKMLAGEMYISLNDLYCEIGLEPIEGGNRIGWSVDGNGILEIRYTSKLAEGTPCVVMEYKPAPKEIY